MAECLRVLAYPRIAKVLAPTRRQEYARRVVAGLAAGADMVAPEMLPKLRAVKADPDDDLFLATALAGGAQVLVSGDRRHLLSMREYAGVRIIDAAAFLGELEPSGDRRVGQAVCRMAAESSRNELLGRDRPAGRDRILGLPERSMEPGTLIVGPVHEGLGLVRLTNGLLASRRYSR